MFHVTQLMNKAFSTVSQLEAEVQQKIAAGRAEVDAKYKELRAEIAKAEISLEEKLEAAFQLGQHSLNPQPVNEPVQESEKSNVIQLPH